MFQFLKKKKQEIIHAPCSGQVIPITEVKDPVFSQKLLGDGFAIIPNDEKLLFRLLVKYYQYFQRNMKLVLEQKKD